MKSHQKYFDRQMIYILHQAMVMLDLCCDSTEIENTEIRLANIYHETNQALERLGYETIVDIDEKVLTVDVFSIFETAEYYKEKEDAIKQLGMIFTQLVNAPPNVAVVSKDSLNKLKYIMDVMGVYKEK